MSTWSGRRRRRGRPGLELRGVRAVEKERQRPVMKTLKSFDHIKTVNGHQAVTFSEAAENLDLLSGDHIVEKCLDEAVLYQTTRLQTDDEVQLMVLQLIVNVVEKMGKKIDDFNLVDNRLSLSIQEKEDTEIAAEYNIQVQIVRSEATLRRVARETLVQRYTHRSANEMTRAA
nr:ATP-dependent DNA helicase PIF1-like [Ipomoea batatas]